jgi:hypothetical protein
MTSGGFSYGSGFLSIGGGTGTLTNVGDFRTVPGAGGFRHVNAQVINQGTMEIQQQLTMNSSSGTHENSGTIEIPTDSTVTIPDGSFFLNGGTVTGDGALDFQGTLLHGHGLMDIAFAAPLSSVTAHDGPLTVGDAASTNGFSIGASLSVGAETVTILDSDGPIVGGPITIAGGTLVSASGIVLNESLTGHGTVEADLTNNGVVSVGLSPGILSVVGNYVQTSSGELNIKLGGSEPGTGFDQLLQSGLLSSASLDGTLNIGTYDGYIPTANDSFQIISSNACVGAFSTVNGTVLPCDGLATVDYGPFDVTLVVSGGCDDADACTQNVCDAEAQACDYPPNYDPAIDCCNSDTGATTTIDDNSVCTQDVCNPDGSVDHIDLTPEGFCCNAETGILTFIDDENECTEDTCNFDGTVDHVDNTPPDQCCSPSTGDLTSIDDALDCTDDVCNPDGSVDHNDTCEPGLSCYPQINECFTPVFASIQGTGLRELTINLAGGAMQEYALRITGDPGNPDVECVSGYIQLDGLLGPEPVALTIADWGTEFTLEDETIIPSATYMLDAEGFLPPDTATGTTWPWGDVDGNLIVNLQDVQQIILGFQQMPQLPMEDLDIEPCGGQGVINFADALIAVFAFQGQTYSASGCAVPCP